MAWVIDSGYPYQDTVSNSLIAVYSEPFPTGIFTINNDYPKYLGRALVDVVSEPYPTGIFFVDNDYPKYLGLNLIDTGAFCWAINLEKVVIPESVKYIGITAFRNTALTEVTIAPDCVYYPTSFPDGCKINFYN